MMLLLMMFKGSHSRAKDCTKSQNMCPQTHSHPLVKLAMGISTIEQQPWACFVGQSFDRGWRERLRQKHNERNLIYINDWFRKGRDLRYFSSPDLLAGAARPSSSYARELDLTSKMLILVLLELLYWKAVWVVARIPWCPLIQFFLMFYSSLLAICFYTWTHRKWSSNLQYDDGRWVESIGSWPSLGISPNGVNHVSWKSLYLKYVKNQSIVLLNKKRIAFELFIV